MILILWVDAPLRRDAQLLSLQTRSAQNLSGHLRVDISRNIVLEEIVLGLVFLMDTKFGTQLKGVINQNLEIWKGRTLSQNKQNKN